MCTNHSLRAKMSTPVEAEKLEELEFNWGKKRGVGGKKKDVQFYESFRYDGVDYALFDCVYMYKEGEPAPFIGKLVKIWENSDKSKSKRIKVHWFFRPSEISNFLRDAVVMENELFFASGDGTGLGNVNPLEAIAGKCNVVCISKDSRNPQPSAEELQMADYVFYRIFDVKSYTISDQMDDTVGGLEVKYVFNRRESVRTLDDPSLKSTGKDEERNAIPCGETPKSDLNKNLDESGKDVKLVGKPSFLDGKLAKTLRSGHAEDSVGVEKDAKAPKDLNALQGKQQKTNDFLSREKSESAYAKDSGGTEKDKKLGETLKSGASKDFQLSGPAAKLVNLDASTKRPLKRSAALCKEKSKEMSLHDADHENKHSMLANDSCSSGGLPPKKAKLDDSVKMSEDCMNNTIEKMKEKTCPGETKNSPRLAAHDNSAKPKLGKGDPKENFNDKVGKPSKTNLPTPSITKRNGDDGKVERRIFEVTRRPIVEKNNWMKLNWEDKMKAAHDQGRLVLFQNLDPEYTSGEVEDIVWHAFKEECTAKMVQQTAISNPFSGQAFVIFKARETVDRVVKRLDDGCLMLPNQRPLVVRIVDFPKFLEKQTFVGHLTIDKARRQTQRDMKEAVATSHYSQNNTIEYEMAMAWCLLQSKSDCWWEKLYEKQRKEIERLMDGLKSK